MRHVICLCVSGVESQQLLVADMFGGSLHLLDPDQTWTRTTFPDGFSGHSTAVVTRRGLLLAGGGYPHRRCVEYITASGEWETRADLITARGNGTAVCVDADTVAVLGGDEGHRVHHQQTSVAVLRVAVCRVVLQLRISNAK